MYQRAMGMPLYKKALLCLGLALVLVLLVALGVWIVLPYLLFNPMVRLEKQTPIRQFLDRQGNVIHIERTFDYQNREPVPLSQVSPAFIDAIIAIEDEGFWRHGGVSYTAIIRAFFSNVLLMRKQSGASTITMQLVSLPDAGHKKTLWNKVQQGCMARYLESVYTKEQILEEYVNRLPFGGKIYGIQAAARFYFDKTAAELSIPEAALLAGLPQRPNGYRPNWHPEIAKRRQYNVLLRMQKAGKLKGASLEELYNAPLYYRDFEEHSYYTRNNRPDREIYLRYAKREAGKDCYDVRTSLDMDIQKAVRGMLKQECAMIPNAKDGAAVVIDVKNSKILAMVGTLDFHEKHTGQINAAVCRRSAGSTLKPFIYAEAIDGGMIAEDTLLLDAPLSFGAYSPGNYDGTFAGDIKAKYALGRSLNTPVLRLLAQLGTERTLDTFSKLGLIANDAKLREKISREKGLTIALGTAGHTLWQLTDAYAALARGGEYKKASFLQDGNGAKGQQVFSKPCALMVSRMLRIYQIPCTNKDIAWKTGTSNGLRDAWCIAYTPDYAVGVWIGNKMPKASSYLVGGKVAAPCAGRIMSSLYVNKSPQWDEPETCLAQSRLCKESGLSPSAKCQNIVEGWTLPGFALPECRKCGEKKRSQIKIISPLEADYVAQEGGASIPLKANASALWYVDGIYVGAVKESQALQFAVGSHKVCAISSDGSLEASVVSFTVKP